MANTTNWIQWKYCHSWLMLKLSSKLIQIINIYVYIYFFYNWILYNTNYYDCKYFSINRNYVYRYNVILSKALLDKFLWAPHELVQWELLSCWNKLKKNTYDKIIFQCMVFFFNVHDNHILCDIIFMVKE